VNQFQQKLLNLLTQLCNVKVVTIFEIFFIDGLEHSAVISDNGGFEVDPLLSWLTEGPPQLQKEGRKPRVGAEIVKQLVDG
jgi:hypothetical protein